MKVNLQSTPLNILLADDDIDDRIFFDKALKEIPVSTMLKTVNNGEELMDYLNKNINPLPDVLFLDLSMPHKTGFECLAEIKENDRLKTLHVVMFTTSFTRGVDLEENLKTTLTKMGARDYIRKPGDFAKYKSAIHQALIKVIEKSSITEKKIIS